MEKHTHEVEVRCRGALLQRHTIEAATPAQAVMLVAVAYEADPVPGIEPDRFLVRTLPDGPIPLYKVELWAGDRLLLSEQVKAMEPEEALGDVALDYSESNHGGEPDRWLVMRESGDDR